MVESPTKAQGVAECFIKGTRPDPSFRKSHTLSTLRTDLIAGTNKCDFRDHKSNRIT